MFEPWISNSCNLLEQIKNLWRNLWGQAVPKDFWGQAHRQSRPAWAWLTPRKNSKKNRSKVWICVTQDNASATLLACYMLHCDGPAARVPGSGQRQQPIAGPAARDSASEESCSVSNWNCSVCNNSFGTYTRCAQHACNPRCHCFQISQGRAAPQLVRTVFRSADRNVGGRQQVSAAAEVLVQLEVAADDPNLDCGEPRNDLEQADSSGQLQCHNGKFACEY